MVISVLSIIMITGITASSSPLFEQKAEALKKSGGKGGDGAKAKGGGIKVVGGKGGTGAKGVSGGNGANGGSGNTGTSGGSGSGGGDGPDH